MSTYLTSSLTHTDTHIYTARPAVDDPTEITRGKKKQDVLIGDKSACGRLTVWEQEMGQLKNAKSYDLSGVSVREFCGKMYPTIAKHG